MLTAPVKSLIISISLPLMISMAVQSLYNLVDSIFVSWLSEKALTATSLANPLQQIMMAVAVGTAIGVNSLLARTLGSGNKKDANLIATTGLVLAVLSSVIFIIFGLFFAEPFIRLFADDPELVEMGTSYIGICTTFCTGIYLGTTGERLLQATGNAFLSMVAQATGAVINCILDPIMIFGLLGCPAMGIAGAAIATVIGQWCAGIVALALNHYKNPDIHFDFKNFKWRASILKEIYAVGVPNMLITGLTSVQSMIVNKLLMSVSATVVAFFGLFHKMQLLVMMPMNGMGMSIVPIVGQAYGAKMGGRIREAVKKILGVATIVMAVCALIFLAVPQWILYLFKAEEGMLAIGIPGLRILAFSLVTMIIANMIGQVFTALGNGVISLCNTLIRNILPIPAIYILVRVAAPINSLWVAILLADVLTFAFSAVMFTRLNRGTIAELVKNEEAAKAAVQADEADKEQSAE